MFIAEVLIQYGAYQVDKTFSYYTEADNVAVGMRVLLICKP